MRTQESVFCSISYLLSLVPKNQQKKLLQDLFLKIDLFYRKQTKEKIFNVNVTFCMEIPTCKCDIKYHRYISKHNGELWEIIILMTMGWDRLTFYLFLQSWNVFQEYFPDHFCLLVTDQFIPIHLIIQSVSQIQINEARC